MDKIKLVAGNSNRPLAEAIAAYLQQPLAKCQVVRLDQKLEEEERPQCRPTVQRQHVQAGRHADQGERGNPHAVAIYRDPVVRPSAVDGD